MREIVNESLLALRCFMERSNLIGYRCGHSVELLRDCCDFIAALHDDAAFVEETVSEALEASGITLCIDCRMESLVMDFDLMRSALVNLIDNARKASESGTVINLRAYENIIEVNDQGKGIPPHEIARIAEPFYMVDRSRSKKSGGSGLGLTLVKRIAEAHGAKLQISSTIGAGTTCRLMFMPIDVDK